MLGLVGMAVMSVPLQVLLVVHNVDNTTACCAGV